MSEFLSAVKDFKGKGQARLLSELGQKRFQLKSEWGPVDQPPHPFSLLQCQNLPSRIEAQIAAPFANRGMGIDRNVQVAELPFEAPVRVLGTLQ